MTVRRAARYRCDLVAPLTLPELGLLEVRVIELSESGAFVETTAGLQHGDVGRLSLPFPGGEPWEVQVRVTSLGKGLREVHQPRIDNLTVRREGVGLEFEAVTDEARERLLGFLDLLEER